MAAIWVVTSALALSFLPVGCDKEVSHSKSASECSHGTAKSKEKTVAESPDGTITTRKEEHKTTVATNKASANKP
jgi:hypothetical protein